MAVFRTRECLGSKMAALVILLLLFNAEFATSHMAMSNPPPIRYATNPYKQTQDYDYTSPLSSSGSNYPCKGYASLMGTSEGQSVATYRAGGTYSVQIAGSATHGGGSCQISLSYDQGGSFKVITSYIGNCVHPDPGGDQTFQFTIPSGAPSGDALLAWSWFNRIGNREMYMNCAVVTISGGSGKRFVVRQDYNATAALAARSLGGLPNIFLANIGNGCTTQANIDLAFPDPGGSLVVGDSGSDQGGPVGVCGPGNYVPGSSSSSSSSSSSNSKSSSGWNSKCQAAAAAGIPCNGANTLNTRAVLVASISATLLACILLA